MARATPHESVGLPLDTTSGSWCVTSTQSTPRSFNLGSAFSLWLSSVGWCYWRMHMEKRRDEYGVVVYGHFVAAPVVSLSYDFLYRLRFNCNSAEKLRWWLALGHIFVFGWSCWSSETTSRHCEVNHLLVLLGSN